MATALAGFGALSATSSLLHTWQLDPYDADTDLKLRHGSAGFLLAHMATRFDTKIEDLSDPALDDFGYAYRVIAGYTELSRHAYGLAMDLNSLQHPLGVDHTFTPEQVARIHTMLEMYDGCIRWGQDYNTRLDPMHFEINKSLAECEAVARWLMYTKRGNRILRMNPGQRDVILA